MERPAKLDSTDWPAIADSAERLGQASVEACEWEPYRPRCPFCHGAGFIETDESGTACTHCDGSGIQPYTYLRISRVKTIGEVYAELRVFLTAREQWGERWMDGIEEGLLIMGFPNSRDLLELDRAREALTAATLELADVSGGHPDENVLAGRVKTGRERFDQAQEKCRPWAERPWPHDSRIVVFSVRGGSEGDYVHVEALDDDGAATCLLLAKTFMGRDAAWAAARRIADLLGV